MKTVKLINFNGNTMIKSDYMCTGLGSCNYVGASKGSLYQLYYFILCVATKTKFLSRLSGGTENKINWKLQKWQQSNKYTLKLLSKCYFVGWQRTKAKLIRTWTNEPLNKLIYARHGLMPIQGYNQIKLANKQNISIPFIYTNNCSTEITNLLCAIFQWNFISAKVLNANW